MQTVQNLYNIAHRGARSLAPENTMPAITKAWEIGAHGIEVDVRATADDQLILLHDYSLTRTTDIESVYPDRKNQPSHTFSLAEIRCLDAGSWFIGTDPFKEIRSGGVPLTEQLAMKGIRIPTLKEALQFVKKRSWYINIELKEVLSPHLIDGVLALIDEVQIPVGCLAISSFNLDYLRRIRQSRPDIEINALIGDSSTVPQDWGDFEFAVYNANANLTDEQQIVRARANGCRVNLYTINDPRQMRRFLAAGVEKIITDYPQILKTITHP